MLSIYDILPQIRKALHPHLILEDNLKMTVLDSGRITVEITARETAFDGTVTYRFTIYEHDILGEATLAARIARFVNALKLIAKEK